MSEPSARMTQLLKMLPRSPDDTFLLYALAMEYRKAGDFPKALEYFDRVIKLDRGYVPAYHQRGLACEQAADLPGARVSFLEGIEAAKRKGDAHARDELMAALENLPAG